MNTVRYKPGTVVWKILKALQERDLTSEEIADLLGREPKDLSPYLAMMKREGLIRVIGRRPGARKKVNLYSASEAPAEGEPEPAKPKPEPKEPESIDGLTVEQAAEFLKSRGYRVIADPLPPKEKCRGYL